MVIIVLLVIFMGVWDFGRAVFAYNGVANAAREGMRAAVVNQNTTVITNKAKSATTTMDSSQVAVTFTPCTVPGVSCLATVKVEYTWAPITPLIRAIVPSLGISSTTSMPIERVYNNPTP